MSFNRSQSFFNIMSLDAIDTTLANNFYSPVSGPTPQNTNYWQPYSGLNNALRKQEGIKSNWGYRQFMTNNAVGIMNYNTIEAQQALGLPIRFHSADRIQDVFNANSDLKQSYVEKEKIQSKLVSPSL
jgi:hypothetical protein